MIILQMFYLSLLDDYAILWPGYAHIMQYIDIYIYNIYIYTYTYTYTYIYIHIL